MKNFYLKLTLLLMIAITSTSAAWAGGTWYSTNMWQVWGWKTGYANDGWVKTGLGSGDDFDIGVITASSDNYTFKGLGVNTGGSGVKWVGAQVWYPDGTNGWITIGSDGGTSGDKYWEYKTLWDYSINKSADPGDYCFSIHFYMNDGGSNYNENERKIKWTIPGFKTDNPTSFSFGSNSPVDLESVAKIGVVHYGDYPTLGGCVLSGTDAGDFEVIDIDYSGVTVVFTPSSVGAKSATLTITDTYSKTWTVTLSGTGAANTTTTRLYFNNYNYNSDWITDGALPRFTCEYTTGIYTRYPMTKCENSTYNWYADVEIKGATVNVDRYNPSSPYNTWNTVSMSGLNASNPYAVLDNYSDGTYYGFATNHPYNDVSGGNIYYDNSKSGLTNTLYVVIGHDYKMSKGGIEDEYSKAHALGYISNTKLYYLSLSDTWHDADYYAFIGASSAPSAGEWGSNDLSSKASSSSYTGIYRDIMDLESGSSYLGYAATKTGGALSITKSPTLNTTQTFNYALSTDGGSTYPALTSGPNTPGQLEMTAYEFTSAACTAVTAKDDEELILSANSTTYTSSLDNVAYTGTTTLEASELRDGYTFVGWYNGSTQRASSTSFTYYPQGDSTFTARYKAHRYTIAFNRNDDQYSGTVASGTMTSISNVVYDQNQTLTANAFKREGYTFAGWATSPTGAVVHADKASVKNLTTSDGATVTLYAKWTDTHEYYYKGASASGWATAANWTRNAVPGSSDDVIILTELNAPSGTTTVNSVRIATSGTYTPVGGDGITANGSLTIPGGAALKVVTSVANCTISANAPTSGTSTTSSTLEIAAGGALAWGTSGSPGNATVGFYTVSGGVPGSQDAVNDYFGIPFTSLNSDAYYNAWVFAVSGTTWGEVHGASLSPWTGYNIIEMKEKSGDTGGSYSLTGTLVSSGASVGSGVTAGTETLYANSWVAPIEISKMSITGTATVYLFTPASFNEIEDEEDPMGNYATYPVNSSSGSYIPSMKSFSVVSSTVSVDYATAVYGQVGGAYSAPRRARYTDYRQAIWDTQDSLFVTVKSASGWGDVLKMFIHEDFSQEYENGWDGPKMEGMWEAPKLYALNNEGEMAVSCVPTAENSVIAFHAGTASNEYTFTFKYSGEDELVLKDTKTGIETPIVDGETYEFTSNKGDDDMRFVIKKAPTVVTGVDEIGDNVSGVQKFMHSGTMYIVRDGRIYSVEGALVK